jgi:two-component system KDP operon response regulator KdpE
VTRVLAVDDDRQLLRALQITLAARGYEVVPAATAPVPLPQPAPCHPMS